MMSGFCVILGVKKSDRDLPNIDGQCFKLGYIIVFLSIISVLFAGENPPEKRIRHPHSKSFVLAYSNIYTEDSKSAFDSGSAPEVRIISPKPGQIVSCTPYDQKIKLAIIDPEGVDWESLSIIIDGFEYLWGDPQIRVIEDSILCFTTIDEWEIFYHGDTVRFALLDIADNEGNHLDSTINFTFIMDTRSPEIVNLAPDADSIFVDFLPEIFEISAYDQNSGMSEDIEFTIGELTFDMDDSGIYRESFRYYFRDGTFTDSFRWIIRTDSLGLSYSECFWEDTVLITMTISDTSGVCENNCREFHWHFYTEGEDAMFCLNDSLTNPYISLSNPNFDFFIYDPDGIDREAITVEINGTSFRYSEYEPYFVFRSPRHFTFRRPSSFDDGERISMIVSANDLCGEPIPTAGAYEMIVDLSPPIIEEDIEHIYYTEVDTAIAIIISDEVSKISRDNSECMIVTTSDFVRYNGNLNYDSLSNIISISLHEDIDLAMEDSLLVILSIKDNIALGPPNSLDTTFYISKFADACSQVSHHIDSPHLSYNRPNPFNSSTDICFNLNAESPVIIEVYDILGNRLSDIDIGHRQEGKNCYLLKTESLESGIYIYRIFAESQSFTGNMLLMK